MNPGAPETEQPAAGRTVTREEFLGLFGAVFLPMFMAAVDQTLLATATPAIAATLGGLRDTSWIAVGYLLASATITPVYGRLGDRRGRRDMLLAALAVFTAGSLACGAAQSLPQLVAARVLQGLGGGGLMTLSQALIGELVPPRERVRYQAYFALVFTTSSIIGPVIGGIVVSHFSWRWLFLANLPLAALAAWRITRLPPGERHPGVGGADLPGHVLFAVGALSLLFWLTSGGHRFPWFSIQSFSLGGTALISLGALYWHERRHPGPFLPIELLHDKAIALSSVLIALFSACLFAIVFFLPIYLQLGHHVSAQLSGLLLLPVTGGMVTGAMTSSRVLSRIGRPYWIPVSGMALSACALLALGLAPPSVALIGVLGFLVGLGFGTVMPTSQVLMQTVAGRQKLGAVTAMASLARSTGGAAGAALFGAVVFALMPGGEGGEVGTDALRSVGELELAAVVRAFHHAFLFAAGVAALAALTASRIPRVRLWDRT
jgi:EmrB/QacA subfamily drug resistance transporter